MYAIIETGGKQFKVAEGDTIKVEKLPKLNKGDSYSFDKVLMVQDGANLRLGSPHLDGASVLAKVIEQGKHKKIVVYKYKPKKGYHKKRGHRQPFTQLKIEAVNT